MTYPHAEPNATPEGYEGYVPPAAAPHSGSPYPPAAQQQPYQGQQQYPAQQPYQGQHLPVQQPPVPNQAYGYPQPKSKIAAGLLGIFLGGLGVHRFYLGHTKIGVIQLVLTLVVSLFTAGLGFVVAGLWGFIEGIMIIAGAAHFQRDAKGIPLRD